MGRVDKVLAESFPEISRSLIQKAIEEGRVSRVNGERLEPKTKLLCGDELMIDLSRPLVQMHAPFEYQLNILYEDDFIIVINKPSGMVTHPGDGTGSDTLVHALMHHLDILCPVGAPDRPGIVHRLDKDTSGVIVVAKTEKAKTGENWASNCFVASQNSKRAALQKAFRFSAVWTPSVLTILRCLGAQSASSF